MESRVFLMEKGDWTECVLSAAVLSLGYLNWECASVHGVLWSASQATISSLEKNEMQHHIEVYCISHASYLWCRYLSQ